MFHWQQEEKLIISYFSFIIITKSQNSAESYLTILNKEICEWLGRIKEQPRLKLLYFCSIPMLLLFIFVDM